MMTRSIATLTLLALLSVPLFTGCESESADVADEVETATDENTSATEAGSDVFVSDEGRFSIVYPGDYSAPTKQVVPVPTEIGNIDMNMYLIDGGDKAFMTAFADYPAELVEDGDPQLMLDMGRDGAIGNVNGELLREKDHEVQGHPAKEFSARGLQDGQDVFMRANIIMANERLYQVLYLGFTEDVLDSDEAAAYMASFKITDASADGE